jgi:hypothetical protein
MELAPVARKWQLRKPIRFDLLSHGIKSERMPTMRKSIRVFAPVVAVFLLCAAAVDAGEVNLSWNSSAGATGYKIYSGASSRNYGTPVDVGNSNAAPFATMTNCERTYFAVTAYNSAGESGYSAEAFSWPRPQLNSVNQADVQRGQNLDLVIQGMNFESGATVQFSNPYIQVNSVNAVCQQLTVNITVGSSAAFGEVNVSVANTSGVTGTASGLIQVVGTSDLPTVENPRRTDKQP